MLLSLSLSLSEMLETLFTTCYPTLYQSPQTEETQLVLESLFFPALLPPLLAAYRSRNYAEEVATARNMCRHVNVTPKDLDVRKKFWLLEQVWAFFRNFCCAYSLISVSTHSRLLPITKPSPSCVVYRTSTHPVPS